METPVLWCLWAYAGKVYKYIVKKEKKRGGGGAFGVG